MSTTRTRLICTTIAVAGALTVTGCTTSGTPTADYVAAANTTSDPEVTVADLDTGGYALVPSAPLPDETDNSKKQYLENRRLGDYVIFPTEADPRFADYSSGSGNVNDLSDFVTDGSPAIDGFVGGFAAHGGEHSSKNTFEISVLRFSSSEAVSTAARQLSDDQIKHPRTASFSGKPNKVTAYPMPTIPNTTGVRSSLDPAPASGETTLTGYTTHDEYVFITSVYGNEKASLPAIANAVTKQTALIDGYQPRDLKAPVPVDEHDIAVYALAPDAEDAEYTPSASRGLGVRAAAHYASDAMSQQTAYDIPNRHGVTDVGVWLTTVYRAPDATKAGGVVTDFVQALTYDNGTKADSPKGLPKAPCVSGVTAGGSATYTCWVQVGRYVGQAQGLELEKVQQQISAQYVILTQADQDAK